MRQPDQREILNAVRQLCVLVRLGYPLSEGLKSMSSDASPWLGSLADHLDHGDTLAGAMARQPRLFSPFFVELIKAAQETPEPNAVLEALSRWLERSDALERKVQNALLYPLLLSLILLLFLALVLSAILPDIILPLVQATQGTAHLSFLGTVMPLLAWPALLLALAVLLALLGIVPMQPLLAYIPGLSSLRGLAAQSLWARAFGSLLGAGLAPIDALDKSLSIVQLPVLRAQLAEAAEQARRGSSLATALAGYPGLEPQLAWSLESDSGDLAPRLLMAADELENQIELRSTQQLRLLGPRALIVVGLLAATGMILFWWPFYSLAIRL